MIYSIFHASPCFSCAICRHRALSDEVDTDEDEADAEQTPTALRPPARLRHATAASTTSGNLGRVLRDLTGFATLTFELLQNG